MKRRPQGFSLLEVLVATLVLSIGLLGIAVLHLTTSVYAESGLHRSQAAALSREIVERMRVNLDEARNGNYDLSTLPDPPLTTNCYGSGADCTPAQMRAHDLRLWSARVAAMLPSGDAVIATTPDPPDPLTVSQVSVTLSWDESRGESGVVQQNFTFELFGVAE